MVTSLDCLPRAEAEQYRNFLLQKKKTGTVSDSHEPNEDVMTNKWIERFTTCNSSRDEPFLPEFAISHWAFFLSSSPPHTFQWCDRFWPKKLTPITT
jgi:hypothetical protein